MEENRLMETKYNERYKKLYMSLDGPRYLKMENLVKINARDSVRALIRLRCRNMEEGNKYWLEDEKLVCVLRSR